MNNESYITIQGWMRNELNLKGNELLVYALIYGFSQDEHSEFYGTWSYIAEWIGSTKRTVSTILNSLCEKGLLQKRTETKDGIKICAYRVMKNFHGGDEKFSRGVMKNFHGGDEKISPNNIDNNTNTNNNIYYSISQQVVDDYHRICLSLPRVIKLTPSREKKIKVRLKSFDYADIIKAFEKTEESDFLSGRSGDWKASFDWLMKNDENMLKVLEGRYDNKASNPFIKMLEEGV